MKNEILTQKLFELKDESYRDFQAPLIPTIDKEKVIGVRTPALRSLAKQYAKSEEREAFLKKLPHFYYEENNLHGAFLEQETDFFECVKKIEKFLPYVDNWATCDMMSPKVLAGNKKALFEKIKIWTKDKKTYTVRYGLKCLMQYFLDENFSPEVLEIAASVRSEEYYVNMMIAWFFATALAKRYDEALPYIKEHRLSAWCHNKAISKANDSFRVSGEHKAYLKNLKIKN